MNKFNSGKVAILALILSLGLSAILFASTLTSISANSNDDDECNETFTYEKSNDYDDTRVDIDFESEDQRIDVSAGAGYQITKVWLDVENDGHGGFYQYSTGPLNNFNPDPGDDIDEVKVEVKKICATSTPTPTATPTATPVVTSTPEATPTPVVTPNCTGDTHLDAAGKNCVSFELGGPQVQGGSSGQVLGTSTMAGAGSFAETFYTAIMTLGGLLTFKGAKRLKKTSKRA